MKRMSVQDLKLKITYMYLVECVSIFFKLSMTSNSYKTSLSISQLK